MGKDFISLSVVVPIFKEGEFLEIVIETINNEVMKTCESYEIVIIDDGSPDNTWDIIRKLAKKYSMIRAARLSRNFGKESAMFAGLEKARGNAVIVIDGDLQHPPSLIPEMVRIWKNSKAEVVEAIKNDRGTESVIRKAGAKLINIVLNKLTGLDLNEASDFKLIDRKVVDELLKMKDRNLFFRGMSEWIGFSHVKIPFNVQNRVGGQSKWSFIRLLRLSVNAATSFSALPLYLITFLGYLFLLFALILGGYALFLKIMGGALTGFTTMIILLLIIGSLLMISLGIIGEYIAKIYDEVKGRPRYVVSDEII